MDRKIKRTFWARYRVAPLIASGPVLIGLLYLAWGVDGLARLNVPAHSITVSPVTKGPFQVYISVVGTVLPIKTVYLDAMDRGRIESVVRDAGSTVNAGDMLLHLSNPSLVLDVMNREAQLFEQQNNLRNTRLAMERNSLALERQLAALDYDIRVARRSYERNDKLASQGLLPLDDLERSRDKLESLLQERKLTARAQEQDLRFQDQQIGMLKSSIDRIESNLRVVRDNLERLNVRAPVSGTLTSLNAQPGQSIGRGERLGRIDVVDRFKIRAAIDEHYLPRLEKGLKGDFELAGRTFRLEVAKIFPEVREHRFDVDLQFADPVQPDVRRGQTVHIRLALGDVSETVLLPRGAFYQTTGGRWAFTLDPSGRHALRRPIRVGRQNPKMFEILEGLEPGERVITSSYETFGDAEKIVLQN